MTIDSRGIYIYSQEDSVNDWPSFLNLGMSSVSNALAEVRSHGVYTASSVTDMMNKKNLIASKGATASPSDPVYFYRSDLARFVKWDGEGFSDVVLAPYDNRIYINGKFYDATGTINITSTPTLTQYSGTYATTMAVTPPFSAPSGWTFTFSCAQSTGFTVVTNTSPAPQSDGKYMVRIIQVGSNSTTALSKLHWQLVKVS